MKTLKEYLIKEGQWTEQKEKAFNDWLEKKYGYEDLYSYFSDLIDFEWKGNNESVLAKYQKELLEKVPSSVIDSAEDAGLDPNEVAWEAIKDIVPYKK